ncbi:G/U mismatch-specific uracil-DNA glycosylase [Jatrophihabitans endophyticus]|uniref:G/U mismatch-specific uracil-DNA glycosylase n=1 Tax=Jatrophihabitans endophyticus TaxID=1206085 RepID=A0A1M5MI72_9ACTN|nr:mismatch-specific DNA-glycosylase [Jatrophihabitans endophyticus]SHG77124.1 G/U mismatch-specific uracil-DNA glycosylase [Jatrophihabitans endophyticus]
MLPDLLRPGLRVVIAGTIAAWHRAERDHYYGGAGTKFWLLLHECGFTPVELSAERDAEVVEHGVGLTDLVRTEHAVRGEPPVFDLAGFHARLAAVDPPAVAFVSKTAASSYARAAGRRLPRGYGELSWTVAGIPAFVLPGPSGANNGMPVPLRVALWRDLVDFLGTL